MHEQTPMIQGSSRLLVRAPLLGVVCTSLVAAPSTRALSARDAIARAVADLPLLLVPLLAIFIFGCVVILPIGLTQMYLYRRQRGLWYSWRHPDRRRASRRAAVPAQLCYPPSPAATLLRSQWEKFDWRKRKRLFEAAANDDSVSRAALLLIVASRLEQSGKNEVAQTCYRQIIERFPGSAAACAASARLVGLSQSPASTGGRDAGLAG